MKSADSHLIDLTSSRLLCIFRFSESRVQPVLSSHSIADATFRRAILCKTSILYAALNRSGWLRALVPLLVRSIVGENCPDRPRHLVGQRYDYHVRRSALADLLDPGTGFFHMVQHAARTMNQQRA